MAAARPAALTFTIEDRSGSTAATATAKLLWEQAPKTCEAICAQLPMESTCFHGKNSGAEALLVTPKVISDVPQDESESGTQTHEFGNVLFGFEPQVGACSLCASIQSSHTCLASRCCARVLCLC